MAGNFWQSSHYQEWLLDKQEIELGRQRDLAALKSPEDLHKVHIFFANFIQCLGGDYLRLRQQVISTAIVYYQRFYSRHSLGDIDPLLLCPTCLHLASKVEECGTMPPNQLVMKCKLIVWQKYQNILRPEYPYRTNHILECEFLLLEMLDCCLIVYHPYRPLTQYVSDLGLQDSILPTAWRIVNDTYRCDVSLMYPPYLIALTCIHMAAVVTKKDVKGWFSELSVDMEKILEITTQILDLYKLWKKYDEAKEVPDLLTRIPKPKFVKSPSPTEALKAKSTPSPKK
jgi:cyclin C